MKILLALLFTVNMMANVSPDYISTFYYDPSVSISFENWKQTDLSIKIMMEDNTIIFHDRLDTKKSDGIKYNLKNLESGKYSIVLEDEAKRVEETIILFDGKLVEKEAKVIYKPLIENMGDKIKVNFLSYSGEAVVSIYNEYGTVYHEKFINASPLNKLFNISDLNPGTYTMMVGDTNSSRSITIER